MTEDALNDLFGAKVNDLTATPRAPRRAGGVPHLPAWPKPDYEFR